MELSSGGIEIAGLLSQHAPRRRVSLPAEHPVRERRDIGGDAAGTDTAKIEDTVVYRDQLSMQPS